MHLAAVGHGLELPAFFRCFLLVPRHGGSATIVWIAERAVSFWDAHEVSATTNAQSKTGTTIVRSLRTCASINHTVSRLYLDAARKLFVMISPIAVAGSTEEMRIFPINVPSRNTSISEFGSTPLRARDLTLRNCKPDLREHGSVHTRTMTAAAFPLSLAVSRLFLVSALGASLTCAGRCCASWSFQPATLFLSQRHRADAEGHRLAIVNQSFAHCRRRRGVAGADGFEFVCVRRALA